MSTRLDFGRHWTVICPRCGAYCFRAIRHDLGKCRKCLTTLKGTQQQPLQRWLDDAYVSAVNNDYLGKKMG